MSAVGEDYKLSDQKDILILVGILTPVRHKWKQIATALKLPTATRQQCSDPDFVTALTNVLEAWSSGEGGKVITLGQLKNALAGPIVGQSVFANEKLISEFNAKKIIEHPLTSNDEALNAAAEVKAKGHIVIDGNLEDNEEDLTPDAANEMESEVQEDQDCYTDQQYFSESKAYKMSRDPCHPLKLCQSSKYPNGEGVKIAIIDMYKEESKCHKALLNSDGNLKIRLIDTTKGRVQEVYYDKKKNLAISDHALQCTAIAVGEEVEGTFFYQGRNVEYKFPGGVAPKANATLYLVNLSSKSNSISLALQEVKNGNFDVLSMSLGSLKNCFYERELYDILKTNTIVVVAGANRGNAVLSCTAKLIDQPRFHDQSLISVGGFNYFNKPADYSPTKEFVTISQICEFLVPISDSTGKLLKVSGGTSMSTPAVAGIICLLIQIGKRHKIDSLSKKEIVQLLKMSIKDDSKMLQDGCYNHEFLRRAFNDGEFFRENK